MSKSIEASARRAETNTAKRTGTSLEKAEANAAKRIGASLKKAEANVIRLVGTLERERKAQGMDISVLSARASLSKFTYYHWYEGKALPSMVNFSAAADALGLELALRRKKTDERHD